MKFAENIKKLIADLRILDIDTTKQMDQKILTDALQIQQQLKQKKLTNTQPNIWKIIMKNKLTKFAAAAVIIIAAITALNQFGMKVDISSPAFADVFEQVKKATSVYYKSTLQLGDRTHSREIMINENGVQRIDPNSGSILIFDFRNGVNLTLHTKNKRGYRTVMTPQPKMKLYNRLDFLATYHEKGLRFVGTEIIDGKETDVYEDEQHLKFSTCTIWVDPETDLPVRVVTEDIPSEDSNYLPIKMLFLGSSDFGDDSSLSAGGYLCGNCTPQYCKEVMTDFQWNIDLDQELFCTEIPEDYEKHEKELSQPNETYLIGTLEFWAEMSDGGMFPIDVNDLMDPNTIKPMLIRKFKKGEDPYQEYNDAAKFMTTLRWGASFAESKIVREKNWHASKEPVQFGQADKPLYWWKLEDSNNYQVIYGDLTIDEVSEDEIPE